MGDKRFRKGEIYTVFRRPFNGATGLPTGNVPANKRSLTSNQFTDSIYIKPGTKVMYVKRGTYGMCRVLHGKTVVQLHEGYLYSDAELKNAKKHWNSVIMQNGWDNRIPLCE